MKSFIRKKALPFLIAFFLALGVIMPAANIKVSASAAEPNNIANIIRAILAGNYPDNQAPADEILLAEWAGVELGDIIMANTSAHDGLKIAYTYESSGLAAVRMQFSVDGGEIWINMRSDIGIIDLESEPSGRRLVILPIETHNQNDMRLRWMAHGGAGENAEFIITHAELISGFQHGERAKPPSPVLSISQASRFPAGFRELAISALIEGLRDEVNQMWDEIFVEAVHGADIIAEQRTVTFFHQPEVRVLAPGVSADVVWTSSDAAVARVIDGMVRAMSPGEAVIRAAAKADPSVFTEFTVTVTPAELFADINYIIRNPYDHVDWDAFGRYKAALHAHTTNSDGLASAAETAERMNELGFRIAAFTDHNYTTKTHENNEKGMVFIPGSSEHSNIIVESMTRSPNNHHFNVFWADIPARAEAYYLMLERLEAAGGIAHINHIGHPAGTEWPMSWDKARAIANNAASFMPFVDILREFPSVIGIEIVNKLDAATQADRVLWDNMLSVLMPDGRNVWGFSNDDSHRSQGIGYSFNIMLLPELTLAETRFAMESGAFFAFSYVDRQYGIFPEPIKQGDRYGNEKTEAVRELPLPMVNRITVSGNTISIEAENYDFIDWIADGITIHRGAEIDLTEHQPYIYSYVRAVVVSENGVLFAQPFGIEIAGEERPPAVLIRVDGEFEDITLPFGVEMAEIERYLPSAAKISITPGSPLAAAQGERAAPVRWNLEDINLGPGEAEQAQTFTVNGMVMLIQGIENPDGVPLEVSVNVTMEPYSN